MAVLVVLYVEGGGAPFCYVPMALPGLQGFIIKVCQFLMYFGIKTSQDIVFTESVIRACLFNTEPLLRCTLIFLYRRLSFQSCEKKGEDEINQAPTYKAI